MTVREIGERIEKLENLWQVSHGVRVYREPEATCGSVVLEVDDQLREFDVSQRHLVDELASRRQKHAYLARVRLRPRIVGLVGESDGHVGMDNRVVPVPRRERHASETRIGQRCLGEYSVLYL